MKKYIFAALMLTAMSAQACTFSWVNYGHDQISNRISKNIGKYVTDEYCEKYNSKYKIVIVTAHYSDTTRSLGHAHVGLVPRGKDNEYPQRARSAYSFANGNFVVSKSYDLATEAVFDSLQDLMSALDDFVPKQ